MIIVIITLIKRRRKKTLLTLWEFIGFSFEETWIPFIQGCFVPSLVEIGPVVLEKIEDFFNFVNVFSLFRNYLSLKKDGTLHLNKLESPSPKDALCQVWLKLAQWFWRRRFFLLSSMYSRHFAFGSDELIKLQQGVMQWPIQYAHIIPHIYAKIIHTKTGTTDKRLIW